MGEKELWHGSELIPKELFDFPLLKGILGRRSRRFGQGMTIPDGPLAYQSSEYPIPLSDAERALLVLVGSGINGWSTGIEYSAATPGAGCNYPVRLAGRTFASAAGVHSSELIFSDDSGTYLTQFRDLKPDTAKGLFEPDSISDSIEGIRRNSVRLSPKRTKIPQSPPHMLMHNFWNANQPGSTLFAPVIDVTQLVLDLLALNLGMGLIPYDPQKKRNCGDLDRFIASGLLKEGARFSFQELELQALTAAAMEVGQICHNQMLLLQAMGLGGWMFGGIRALTIMGAEPEVPGFGFRFVRNADWMSPNPVGIDRYFESYCPPYFSSMCEAVAAFVALKFGPGGTYDPHSPGPYLKNVEVKSQTQRYSTEFIELLGEVAQYIFSNYGKFPGTVPSVYIRAYLQAHHLDTGFYDRHFGKDAYLDTHKNHWQHWHETSGEKFSAVTELQKLSKLVNESYGNNSLVYSYFETEADLTEITHFLRWDAVQPPFNEYLRHWLPKSREPLTAVLEKHIEIEEGEEHSRLFREMLMHLDSRVAEPAPVNHAILERLNYTFSPECAEENDFAFFLGGFYATEIMSAKRCKQIYRGLRRVGIQDSELKYFLIHFSVDADHGKEVCDEMIFPLLSKQPQLFPSVKRGVWDRLERSRNFLTWYEQDILQLPLARRAM